MSIFNTFLAKIFPVMGAVNEDDVKVHDVTPFAKEFDLEAMEVIRNAPVWMSRAERLLLYTLIFTLRPSRYLEIGTFQGGSALVVNAALDALNSQTPLICVDPEWNVAPEDWQKIEHRATFIEGYSPAILPKAEEAAGGKFDFVLIDGDHSYEGVLRDARGVLPHLAPNAYLLFHDSFFTNVARGLNQFANENANQLVDFGSLTREVTVEAHEEKGAIQWGGLRLMQRRS
ncbi:MAG: class I SAM-dependent methyltransferase [Ardenticatenaceae bacterium]|nr:class I SAM-dependent methyltransferase [Anaerolineales bacterium]MCB9006628.1 class I SAM-dependent methyltransferase [Ardenticatenaceae bacterium]